MFYKISELFRTRREMRETRAVVFQYLKDHYSFFDIITGRWRNTPVMNPYYKNRSRKSIHRKGYTRKCNYGTFDLR